MKYLLAISLGPVQDFIAAARRTRDLWFGSFLLSEISKAAARAVRDNGGKLIFPNPTNPDKDLKPESAFNVVNIIVAELPEGLLPKDVATVAENAAKKKCWERHAAKTKEIADALIDKTPRSGKTLWDKQIEDVVEFYAAWAPLKSDGDYSGARREVMLLLAGRKALRDFKFHRGEPKIPKSSLDGARESVLIQGATREETRQRRQDILLGDKKLAQRLRLSRGEELDAVGLTKRTAINRAFASIVRVAADPWIRGIDDDGGNAEETLKSIGDECAKVFYYKDEQTPHTTGTGEHYRNTIFCYDGAVLFSSRLAGMLRKRKAKQGKTESDEAGLLDRDERAALERIRHELLPRLQTQLGYGEPEPYLAILVADGDRMGKTLSAIKALEKHQAFSQQLAKFAGKAREIVTEHKGCLVYAGGDDILAFVPVDRCLDCARALHDQFGDLLKDYEDDTGQPPTLSVGIAIGHCQEPLEDLLQYARDAEKNAKEPDRNGLAVHLHTRGGPPVCVRAPWVDGSDAQQSLDKRLLKWAGMHLEEQLSDKAVYDLRELATEYAGWPRSARTDQAIKKDIARLLSRKKAVRETLDTSQFNKELEVCFTASERVNVEQQDTFLDHHPGVMRLAAEWLVARKIARVMRQAQRKKASTHEESRP